MNANAEHSSLHKNFNSEDQEKRKRRLIYAARLMRRPSCEDEFVLHLRNPQCTSQVCIPVQARRQRACYRAEIRDVPHFKMT